MDLKKTIKGSSIFLLCEFICFGFLLKLHEIILQPNLQTIDIYIEHNKFANSMVFIIPVLFGLLIFLILKFYYKKEKIYILGISILIAISVGLYLLLDDSMKGNAYTFIIAFIFYLLPLVGLWLCVYIIHEKIKDMFP